MTTKDNMPPLPEARGVISYDLTSQNGRAYSEADMYAYALAYAADLRKRVAEQADRIAALTEKCTLYAASLEQADKELRIYKSAADAEARNADHWKAKHNALAAARHPSKDWCPECHARESDIAAARQPVEVEPVGYVCESDAKLLQEPGSTLSRVAVSRNSGKGKVAIFLSTSPAALVDREYGPDGQPRCTAFVEAGKPIPPEPDKLTIDLFAQQQTEGEG